MRYQSKTPPMQSNAPVMTLEDLRQFRSGIFATNTVKASHDRTLLVWQWCMVGRSSDVATSTFADLQWIDNYLLFQVTRPKTSHQHSISLFHALMIWQYNTIHSLHGMSADIPSDKLFTQLGSGEFTDGTASCIYRLLANASGDQVTQNLKSHSARRGSAVQASSHPEVKLCDLRVSPRGRWNMDSFNTLMEYMAATSAADHKVGRVLVGWEYPRSKVIRRDSRTILHFKASPSEHSRLASIRDYIDAERQQTFLHRCDFLHVLVVTLVMHFRATHDLQPQHTLHSTMYITSDEEAGKVQHRTCMLFEWSDDIRARFAAENAMSLPLDKLGQTIASCSDQVPAPLESSATLVDTVVRLGHTVRSLAADVAHIRGTVGMIVNQ
ncbi:TPA: LOW QUALITY PROTEIN: hypothetical protein N0F65_008985 [Lagenidium giganteum]|uniref:Ndc10 domain-containing protein n=1 Tax=Lagenidium giganteum TaxID=4803 RepID=A0AAV2YJL3_9STRA|nr:TPA: LOW QUALITY PROTEIN: hypothetical protein N0F65_008985 [Lagenidium giganteum]